MDVVTDAATAPAPNGQRAWADGVGRMVVYSALMVAFFTVPSNLAFIARDGGILGIGSPWPMYVGMLLALGFGIAAHNAYSRSKAALARDPSLRGRWLVRNLWWVVLALLIVPSLIGFGLAVAFFGVERFG